MSFRLLSLFGIFILLGIAVIVFLPAEMTLMVTKLYGESIVMHMKVIAVLIFVLYAIAFAFTIPIAAVLGIATGFIYGIVFGGLLLLAATLVGSLSLFLYGKYGTRKWGKIILQEDYDRVFREAKEHPLSFLLSTRFAPFVPFPLSHLVPGEAGLKTRDFILVTLLGTIPSTLVFVVLGAGFRTLNTGETLTPFLLSTGLAALKLFVLLGVGIRKYLLNRKKLVIEE